MEKQDIKNVIQLKINALETQWNKVVDEEDRNTPSDYLKAGAIQGAINALIDLLVEVDRMA